MKNMLLDLCLKFFKRSRNIIRLPKGKRFFAIQQEDLKQIIKQTNDISTKVFVLSAGEKTANISAGFETLLSSTHQLNQ